MHVINYDAFITFLIFRRSEKRLFRICFSPAGAQRHQNTRCATLLSAVYSIYSVYPLPRHRPLTPIKGRCGYSLTVVHFRKLRNSVKIGSHRNGYPVI